jgi:hypothetical protein
VSDIGMGINSHSRQGYCEAAGTGCWRIKYWHSEGFASIKLYHF